MITTIYKGNVDPLDISNRRPIALLNVDYKILSKIINYRILHLLPRLILPNQTGFVPGRSIFDNIVTMNASFDFSMPSPNNPHPIITFIDFEKAFDSSLMQAIMRTLAHLGFPRSTLKLIRNMLTGASAE